MSRYRSDKSFINIDVLPNLYKIGDAVLLKGPRGVDPTAHRIDKVLGDGRYTLARDGKSDGKIYREEDLRMDLGSLGGRQSREVVRPAKRENPRVYPSHNLTLQEWGKDTRLAALLGHQSGSLLTQELEGTTQKEVNEFEPGLPTLSDEPSDHDRSPATPSRKELSVFDPKLSFTTGYHDRSEETPSGEELSDPESDGRPLATPTFVVSEGDRSQETRSRGGLIQFEPSTHYKRTDVHGAPVDVVEERRKARENVARTTEKERKPHKRSHAPVPLAKAIEEQAKERQEQVKAREERGKAVKAEMSSQERSNFHRPLAKPLGVGREEIDPNVVHGETSVGGLKMLSSKTKKGNGLQDLAEDTTIATGPGTKHDWIDSFPKFSVREVLIQLFRQSSPTGPRRWSIKSLSSVFGLGECLLEGGKTRVRWRCVCGRNMYDDFIELRPGAAAEFEKWLNRSIKNHAVARASNPSQDGTLRSSTSSRAGVSGQEQTAGSDISLQPLSWAASMMPESDKNAPVTIDVHLEKCWLLICGQPRRGPDSLLAQLDLSSKPSDKDLFDSMKKFHSSLRSTFTLRPVLKGVQTIRFVQFQLHKMARVDIRKFPDMPPETRRDEYLYEPCDLIPPVGENLMTHWFQHPEEAWDLPYAYSLFPKKRKGQLDVDLSHGPSVAWGIQIVEGWLSSRIWLLSLSLFLCGSLAFGICWTIFKHDIQGAFGVSAYIVAFLTLAVGAAQANFG